MLILSPWSLPKPQNGVVPGWLLGRSCLVISCAGLLGSCRLWGGGLFLSLNTTRASHMILKKMIATVLVDRLSHAGEGSSR
jgi:hypothetical protein